MITSTKKEMSRVCYNVFNLLFLNLFLVSCHSNVEICQDNQANLEGFNSKKIEIKNNISELLLEVKFANEKLERAKENRASDWFDSNKKEERIRDAERVILRLKSELNSKENELRAIDDAITRIKKELKKFNC